MAGNFLDVRAMVPGVNGGQLFAPALDSGCVSCFLHLLETGLVGLTPCCAGPSSPSFFAELLPHPRLAAPSTGPTAALLHPDTEVPGRAFPKTALADKGHTQKAQDTDDPHCLNQAAVLKKGTGCFKDLLLFPNLCSVLL